MSKRVDEAIKRQDEVARQIDEDRRTMVRDGLDHLRNGDEDAAFALCDKFYWHHDSDAALAAIEVLQTVIDLERASTVQGLEDYVKEAERDE